MQIAWRPVGADDIPAWARLLAAMEVVDQTGEHYDEEDLVEEFGDPSMGPHDRLSGWAGDEMVAYAGLRPRRTLTDSQRIDVEGGVVPSRRGEGLGAELMRWAVERAAELRAEHAPHLPARIHAHADLANVDQVSLFEDAGFEAVNWSAVMRVHLDADVFEARPADLPAGLSLLGYDARWSTPTRAAHNDAFQDHWGFVAWDEAMWHQWVDDSKNFRPELSWVVVDDADPSHVIAYVQSSEFEAYQAMTGRREAYLAKIGVRRDYRGRGVASALLRHALHAYRSQGYVESSLDVDTNNPTGAFGLYERAGYRVERRTATFLRTVPVA
jgi:ribosomal protein S18 acetylase RimI-like enzyme